MTKEEQNVIENSGRGGIMRIIFLFVLMVTVASLFPVYMQNSIERLYETSESLRKKVDLLNREILLKDFEINKLSSMDYLSKFATRAELGLNGVPVKVMVTGVTNE